MKSAQPRRADSSVALLQRQPAVPHVGGTRRPDQLNAHRRGSARCTKLSTKVLAMRSNTGLTTASSAGC
jgi:hypothetical protein